MRNLVNILTGLVVTLLLALIVAYLGRIIDYDIKSLSDLVIAVPFLMLLGILCVAAVTSVLALKYLIFHKPKTKGEKELLGINRELGIYVYGNLIFLAYILFRGTAFLDKVGQDPFTYTLVILYLLIYLYSYKYWKKRTYSLAPFLLIITLPMLVALYLLEMSLTTIFVK